MRYLIILLALVSMSVGAEGKKVELSEAEKAYIERVDKCFINQIKMESGLMRRIGFKKVTAAKLGYDAKAMEYRIRYYTTINKVDYSFTRTYSCIFT